MKITSIVARYLLGLMFTVFGLNGFLNFIHQPPPANPLAIQFLVSVSESHFAAFFFAIQLVGGLPLLSAPSSFRITGKPEVTVETRWDEKAGLRRDAIRSQVIDALEGARDKGDRQ